MPIKEPDSLKALKFMLNTIADEVEKTTDTMAEKDIVEEIKNED